MSQWDIWPKNRQAYYGTLAQYDMWYFGHESVPCRDPRQGYEEFPRHLFVTSRLET